MIARRLGVVTGKPTDPRSMNRFLYAEGNPWSMVDPSGHASFYEGFGCGPGSTYCGSTGNDQSFHKNFQRVVATAHNDYLHRARTRMYDSTPTISTEWASGDDWGETTRITLNTAAATSPDARILGGIGYKGGEDGLIGAAKGIAGEVVDFGVGIVTTPIYALTHLSDAATGLQCFVLDGCLSGAAHDLGWDHPIDNLGAGVDAFMHMSDQEKARFATGVTLTALTLRGGFKGTRSEPDVPEPTVDSPLIKPGSSGGATAGQPFPQSIRAQALAENPDVCVYCRMKTSTPNVDHAIPRIQDGDATLPNAQTTCVWCNSSKGGRSQPVNQPPGYTGPWPPPWW